MHLTILDNVSLKDTIDLYWIKVPKKHRLSRLNYLRITADFMTFIMKLVFQGMKVHLPVKCGSFHIIGRKQNFDKLDGLDLKKDKLKITNQFPVDWGATNKLWKTNPQAKKEKRLIYHFNEHTEHILYRIHWSVRDSKLTNSRFYKFNLSRANRLSLAQLIKNGQEFNLLKKYTNVGNIGN